MTIVNHSGSRVEFLSNWFSKLYETNKIQGEKLKRRNKRKRRNKKNTNKKNNQSTESTAHRRNEN